MLIRAVLVWIGLLTLAILNGAVREALLVPSVGRAAARALSTVILSALIAAAGWIAMPWIEPHTRRDAWVVGGLWVVLTLGFEFLAGHFLFGKPWPELLADYDLVAGRIWVLVLIVTLVTPIAAFTLAGNRS